MLTSTTPHSPRSIEDLPPFRHSEEPEHPLAAKVRGELPTWLRGELVRTCPAVFESSGWRAEHWFDGLGMIYAFRVDAPTSVTFRARLLDSETSRDAAEGNARLAGFGTPMMRSLWRRLLEPIPRSSDNTNVNIVRMGDDLVAMTESDRQMRIDDETLAARGEVAYADDALGHAILSPHPHFDFDRGRVVNVATQFGVKGVISIYEHAPAARRREVVGSWRTGRVPYVHSFGLTPANAIVVAHPFTTRPVGLLWSDKGFIDHFGWHAEEGSRLIVIDRQTGATREHLTDAFFVFHMVNAFERGDETVLDLLAYHDSDIVAALRVDRMREALPDLRPSLVRVRMRRGQERAPLEHLSDVGFEFPATNYRRVNGREHRFVWGAADGPTANGAYESAIVKIDVGSGAASRFSLDGHIFGEPIFVARPDAADEDDGVLLSVGSSVKASTSTLIVVDAQRMELVASAEIPSSIPLGFHGSFIRASVATPVSA